MTDEIDYTPRPHRTLEEIEDLAAFIEARVEPVRAAAAHGSDEHEAFEALLNLVAFTKGGAEASVQNGNDPYWQFHSLAVAARRWKGHHDFQAGWAWDAV